MTPSYGQRGKKNSRALHAMCPIAVSGLIGDLLRPKGFGTYTSLRALMHNCSGTCVSLQLPTAKTYWGTYAVIGETHKNEKKGLVCSTEKFLIMYLLNNS